MKLLLKLDPLMRISKASDNIQTFGCFQLSIMYMVLPEGTLDPQQLTDIVTKITKAGVDIIDAYNKENENALGNKETGEQVGDIPA